MRVVAIGGSASVGKTTCAGRLAELLGVKDIVHVDDLSTVLQTEGRPHVLDSIERTWQQPAEYLVQMLIEWTRQLHPAILEAVEQLAPTGGVIEGEGIDPRLGVKFASAGVTCVYVIETSRARLRETFEGRTSTRRFAALTQNEQTTVVEMNRLYGNWLRSSAVQAGQPWVPSHPWPTLPQRILAAIN